MEDKQVFSTPFIAAPELPSQEGPEGILFDFNDGARIFLPKGNWLVEISDEETGNVLFREFVEQGWVISTKKYYIKFRIAIWKGSDQFLVFEHTMNLLKKEVLISFPTGTLGDLIGWVPYAERFRSVHGCKLTCTMAKNIIEIFKNKYKHINFVEHNAYQNNEKKHQNPYATYRVGLFFNGNTNNQPIDFRQVGLHRTAGYILGVNPQEIRPDIRVKSQRLIKEPYVCIATMATTQAKFWNNASGWDEVIRYLKSIGYRVLCIDRESVVGHGFVWNRTPHEAENYTGDLPLAERIAMLQHADFFIGLGSGLSWLAWACQIPVVLISGFSLPNCEFHTPYRVFNSHVCNGCWDDTKVNFDHGDFLWCPRFKNTERQYECTRFITGKHVINVINKLIEDKSS